MKRHDRPYGCTFSTCNKAFGSKGDWKRHENSQHISRKTVRADEVKGDFWCGFCAKLIDFKEGRVAWDERFDHIDDHFMGRRGLPKQGIQDWVPDKDAQPANASLGPVHSSKDLKTTKSGKGRRLKVSQKVPSDGLLVWMDPETSLMAGSSAKPRVSYPRSVRGQGQKKN